jgi:hypothetical protein
MATKHIVYLDLLEDPYWRVSALDAILAWWVLKSGSMYPSQDRD